LQLFFLFDSRPRSCGKIDQKSSSALRLLLPPERLRARRRFGILNGPSIATSAARVSRVILIGAGGKHGLHFCPGGNHQLNSIARLIFISAQMLRTANQINHCLHFRLGAFVDQGRVSLGKSREHHRWFHTRVGLMQTELND